MALVKLNNKAVSNATAFGSITALGSMTFIKKLTASSSATLSFVDGTDGVVLDSTYKEYMFTFNNINPATDNVKFQFNMSVDGGSNYNVIKTTTVFQAYHQESGANSPVEYRDEKDLAQSTAFQILGSGIGNGADECLCGNLQLFNPSSTTFVKHFMNVSQLYDGNNTMSLNSFTAGYGNTTSEVDAIRFQMDSGNFDGDICLYGIA